ncbi:MAG: hypothetical protein IVW36_06995 [Dehalococcoidia bacterium]|nr:hypothetical protein [Dehalococcoidia bacterium]
MASISRSAPPSLQARTRSGATPLVWGAPFAAVLAGIGAEFLDFRELRLPFLLGVGLGVLATSYALFGTRAGGRRFALTTLIGMGTWGGAESLYAVLHVARGEAFQAPRFGPQATQALALIGVHALFLGLPTGAAAAAIGHLARLRTRSAACADRDEPA